MMNALRVYSFLLAFTALCAGADAQISERHDRGQPLAAGSRTAPLTIAQKSVHGMDYDVYIRLNAGMSEGELLSRAGPPDSESVENFKDDIVKSYYYMPTSANPYVTTVKLRGGRLISVDRIKRN